MGKEIKFDASIENHKDFGNATRNLKDGKGRYDLLPDVLVDVINYRIDKNVTEHELLSYAMNNQYLDAICAFIEIYYSNMGHPLLHMLKELSLHFEQGAKIYGPRNCENGIPLWSFTDSGIRHLVQFMNGEVDEPHDRSFLWNFTMALWTLKNRPDLCYKDSVNNKETVSEKKEMTEIEKACSEWFSCSLDVLMNKLIDHIIAKYGDLKMCETFVNLIKPTGDVVKCNKENFDKQMNGEDDTLSTIQVKTSKNVNDIYYYYTPLDLSCKQNNIYKPFHYEPKARNILFFIAESIVKPDFYEIYMFEYDESFKRIWTYDGYVDKKYIHSVYENETLKFLMKAHECGNIDITTMMVFDFMLQHFDVIDDKIVQEIFEGLYNYLTKDKYKKKNESSDEVDFKSLIK